MLHNGMAGGRLDTVISLNSYIILVKAKKFNSYGVRTPTLVKSYLYRILRSSALERFRGILLNPRRLRSTR